MIVSKDTDVLILLVYSFVTSKWCIKIDIEKFIDKGKIVEFYGKDVILKLPYIIAVRGCDIIYFYFIKAFTNL